MNRREYFGGIAMAGDFDLAFQKIMLGLHDLDFVDVFTEIAMCCKHFLYFADRMVARASQCGIVQGFIQFDEHRKQTARQFAGANQISSSAGTAS